MAISWQSIKLVWGKAKKKRSERLLARYWQPRMNKIVSNYADEINQINWDRARYDDDYAIAEIAQAIAKRDTRTRDLFEYVRENQRQISKAEIRKIQKRRKRIYEKFGCFFSCLGCLLWPIVWGLFGVVWYYVVLVPVEKFFINSDNGLLGVSGGLLCLLSGLLPIFGPLIVWKKVKRHLFGEETDDEKTLDTVDALHQSIIFGEETDDEKTL